MSNKREPESRAMLEARVELAAIAGELRTIKARAVALERRLRRAARTAEVVGTIEGKPYTVEVCLAGSIHGELHDNEGNLTEAVRVFAHLAHEDHRKWARFVIKDWKGELARKPAAGKEQEPVPPSARRCNEVELLPDP